jgi:arylsulfatase A-like enzyme
LKNLRSIYLCLVLLVIPSCADEQIVRHAILITVDTLRPDRIGAYGYERAESPNLDALASESIRFENAYAHSSMTVPSFASLLSGTLPARHRIYENGGRLPKNLPTMATRLHEEGFSTAAFLGNYALRPSRKFDRGFDVYTQEYKAKEAVRDHPENLAGPLTDEAIDWLSKRDPKERLFLWVHYQEPHGPYTPPSFRPVDESESQRVLPENPTNSGRDGIPKYQWLGHGRIAEYESRYDGEITDFDHHLGRLLAALREQGILDQSVLIFASDHGEAFGEDGLYFVHGDGLGEALLRVPLLVRLPHVPSAVREDRVRLIDLPTTLLESVGVQAKEFQGKNLLLNNGDRPVVAQVRSERKYLWRSYREGGYELRQLGTRPPELYGAEGMSPQDAKKIRTRMHDVLKRVAPWRKSQEPESPLTQEEEDALRALGYLD